MIFLNFAIQKLIQVFNLSRFVSLTCCPFVKILRQYALQYSMQSNAEH